MTKPLTLLQRMLRLQKLYSDRRAWGKDYFKIRRANHTCYCLMGGLNKIRGKNLDADILTVEQDELDALGFTGEEEIFAWNDARERRVTDVQARVALGVKNARALSKQQKSQQQ